MVSFCFHYPQHLDHHHPGQQSNETVPLGFAIILLPWKILLVVGGSRDTLLFVSLLPPTTVVLLLLLLLQKGTARWMNGEVALSVFGSLR